MNTTTTIDQPLVDSTLEVWGAKLTSYLGAMGMVILQYDCLLTLKYEVRLVWPGELSLAKVLYYINRYLSFFAMIFCNYQVSGIRPAVSTNLCQAWILVSATALPISNFSSTVLLTLRVNALYRRVRWFSPLLWTAFVLFQGLRTAIMVYGGAELFWSLKYSPISNVCIPTDTKYRSAALVMVPGIYDFILLGLTLFRGIQSLRTNSNSAVMITLVRDELIYFFVISSLRIFNSIVWLILSPSLIGVAIYAEWGLESTLTSRFFLNLRNIAFHQQQTMIGTRAAIPTVAAPRAHPTLKQAGWPATEFILDTSIDKITHNSETGTNEGAIQQAEIFHLEVIRSRNSRNGENHDSGTKNDVEQ